jgi:hypothetical protein
MVSRLDALLQKQQAALEAASAAAKALAAIEDLQSQQTQALQSLEKAVQNQLYAIKVRPAGLVAPWRCCSLLV